MGGTKSSISPLEEITLLPKIVQTLLKEIELHKTLSTKDSSKKETRLLLTKSENNSFPQNECLCTIENLSIDNFCVLLAMVIVKAARKRFEHSSENEPKSTKLF